MTDLHKEKFQAERGGSGQLSMQSGGAETALPECGHQGKLQQYKQDRKYKKQTRVAED